MQRQKWHSLFIGLGITLFVCPLAYGGRTLNAECKDAKSEVRLMNGTDHTVQGAVGASDMFDSASYYDIKSNEIRCWPRSGTALRVWFKDGGSEVTGRADAGQTLSFVGAGSPLAGGEVTYTPPIYMPADACKPAGEDISITNLSGHTIGIAVVNGTTKPAGSLSIKLYNKNTTACFMRASVEKPLIIISDNPSSGKIDQYADLIGVKPKYYHGIGKLSYSATPQGQTAPAANAHWEQIAPPSGVKFKQVAVGSVRSIWALGSAGKLWKWNGSRWEDKGCCVSGYLSATADGALWATHPPNNNRVLRWTGSRWDENFPSGMKQVTAVSSTTVWGVDDSGSLFSLSGSSWQNKGCCVTQISAGADGVLWATHPPNNNRVLRWTGSRWDESLPAGMVYVSVGNAQNIWALDAAGQVFKWSGTAWQKMPGTLRSISAASDGTVWGANSNGIPYKWVP